MSTVKKFGCAGLPAWMTSEFRELVAAFRKALAGLITSLPYFRAWSCVSFEKERGLGGTNL